MTISPGEGITWTNQDSKDASVTSITGVWDSGRIRPGQSFSHEFDEPGDYEYLSVFDPSLEGVIHVVGN